MKKTNGIQSSSVETDFRSMARKCTVEKSDQISNPVYECWENPSMDTFPHQKTVSFRLIDDSVIAPVVEKLSIDIGFTMTENLDPSELPRGGIGEVFRSCGLSEWDIYGLQDDFCWPNCETFIETYKDMIADYLEKNFRD